MNHALVADLFPGAQTREWANSIIPGWQTCNSSIAYHPEGGYRATLRLVNYAMDEATLQYPTAGADGVIRTKTLLAVCDSQWNILDAQVIDDSAVSRNAYPVVRGMEDCRLYYGLDGHWHVYGTLREHRPDGLCEMADDTLEGAVVVHRQIMANPVPGRPQKNWTVLDRGPSFLYTPNPVVYWDPPWEGEPARLQTVGALDGLSADLRGSTQAVEYLGGFLTVTHEVEWGENPRRNYLHRFLYFGAKRQPRWSAPFHFRAPGVEFAAGLVVQDDRAVVSVGYKDRSCLLCTIPLTSLPPCS